MVLEVVRVEEAVARRVARAESQRARLLFETGGQLVKGNQVLIGGVPVGSVDDVKLIDKSFKELRYALEIPQQEQRLELTDTLTDLTGTLDPVARLFSESPSRMVVIPCRSVASRWRAAWKKR